MGLLEIGYHFVIQEDGQITECRPHNTVGSHLRPANDSTIGVALAGGRGPDDGDGLPTALDTFKPDQKDALRFLCAVYLPKFYGVLPLLGHSERSPRRATRPCPPTDMEAIRAWIKTPKSPA